MMYNQQGTDAMPIVQDNECVVPSLQPEKRQ